MLSEIARVLKEDNKRLLAALFWTPVSYKNPDQPGVFFVTKRFRHSTAIPPDDRYVDTEEYLGDDDWCGTKEEDIIAWAPAPGPWEGD